MSQQFEPGSHWHLTVKDHAGKVTRGFHQVVFDANGFVMTRSLNTQGEDQSHYNSEGTLVDKQNLIDKGAIQKAVPARMNPTYGTMEKVKP